MNNRKVKTDEKCKSTACLDDETPCVREPLRFDATVIRMHMRVEQ